jgi:hypothetical protein
LQTWKGQCYSVKCAANKVKSLPKLITAVSP